MCGAHLVFSQVEITLANKEGERSKHTTLCTCWEVHLRWATLCVVRVAFDQACKNADKVQRGFASAEDIWSDPRFTVMVGIVIRTGWSPRLFLRGRIYLIVRCLKSVLETLIYILSCLLEGYSYYTGRLLEAREKEEERCISLVSWIICLFALEMSQLINC